MHRTKLVSLLLFVSLSCSVLVAQYIQNGTSQQPNANFNIAGSGTANSFNSATKYKIGGGTVLSIGSKADGNLFVGEEAGQNDTVGQGFDNVFTGYQAGLDNTTGAGNTFTGYQAGSHNVGATYNVFIGSQAGYQNSSGSSNVFIGAGAGFTNTTGGGNVFTGLDAGQFSNGSGNIFTGTVAGGYNTTGSYNVFTGYEAGYSNTTGSDNIFTGLEAGYSNSTGNGNVFLGPFAGYYIVNGSSNIDIGFDVGPSGDESNTIRIGAEDVQAATYIAGIYSHGSSGGIPVYINSSGQLGTYTSSRRFKEQINDMGDATSKLLELRPVTFFYKPEYDDGSHQLQYGLIAEEVAKVYPELVTYDQDGQPYTVRYQYLASMLLNEVQKQHKVVTQQADQIASLEKINQSQQAQIEAMKLQLQQQSQEFELRFSRLEKAAGVGTSILTANTK